MVVLVGVNETNDYNTSMVKMVSFDESTVKGMVETSAVESRDVSFAKLAAVMMKVDFPVAGIELDKRTGKFTGNNGALNRYGNCFVPNGKNSPLVVLARYVNSGDTIGFCVSDCFGHIKNILEADAIKYANLNGIANGKVTDRGGKQVISSIVGEYLTFEIEAPAQKNTQAAPKAPVQQTQPSVNTESATKTPVGSGVKTAVPNGMSVQKPAQKQEVDTMDTSEVDRSMYNRPLLKPDGLTDYEGGDLKDADGMTVNTKVRLCIDTIRQLNGFVYSYLTAVALVPCAPDNGQGIDTAAVSPFTNSLYYNCDFINSLTVGQVLFTMIHEIYHLIYGHGLRQGKRDPEVWNIAADYFVNAMIADQFNLRRWPERVPINEQCSFIWAPSMPPLNEKRNYIEGIRGLLFDPTLDLGTETAEHIYTRLMSVYEQRKRAKAAANNGGNATGVSTGNTGKVTLVPLTLIHGIKGNETDVEDDYVSPTVDEMAVKIADMMEFKDKIKQAVQQAMQQQGQGQGQGQQGQGQGQGGQQKQGQQGQGQGQSQKGQGQGQQGQGQGQDGPDGQGNNQGQQSGKGQGRNKAGGKGGVVVVNQFDPNNYKGDFVQDTKDTKDMGEKIKEAGEKNDQLLQNARIQASSQGYSPVGGSTFEQMYERLLERIVTPRLDFRAVISDWFNIEEEYDTSWKRPGRRGEMIAGSGIDWPGRVKSGEHLGIKALFAIDASGSVGENDLMYAIGYIKKLCMDVGKVDLEVITWHTEVVGSYEIKNIHDMTKLKLPPGGGTEPSCIFEYALGKTSAASREGTGQPYRRDPSDKPDVIIIVTDGQFGNAYARYKSVAEHVLWIINGSDDEFYGFKPAFGRKAPIDPRKPNYWSQD